MRRWLRTRLFLFKARRRAPGYTTENYTCSPAAWAWSQGRGRERVIRGMSPRWREDTQRVVVEHDAGSWTLYGYEYWQEKQNQDHFSKL